MRGLCIVVFLLGQDFAWKVYCTIIRYHSEFLLVLPVLILDLNLFMSCLKSTMR
jgi:hypothetical protein